MTIDLPGVSAPEEQWCRYGTSKLLCRGPERPLDTPYLAFLGGSETFGRFVEQPYPALVESVLGTPCVNLGCANAGLDTYLNDTEISGIAARAELAVIQLPGAQNVSNRYYRVHPRRNDRFIGPRQKLRSLFDNVDFTDYNFNTHLIAGLSRQSAPHFALVREELQRQWLNRMNALLSRMRRKPILLWLRKRNPYAAEAGLGDDPLLVSSGMLDELRHKVSGVIELWVTPAAQSGDISKMVFGPLQAPAAAGSIGPVAHHAIAERLLPDLRAAQ